jgi:glutaredoxin
MKTAALLSVLVAVVLSVTSGCHKKSAADADEAAAASSATPVTLPPLVFKDDTPNALLTWVDDKGDFHVAEHVADVPEANREQVRVVLADHKDGTGDTIYVADLRTKGADGAYAVTSMPRSAWDELGASKRKARLEALAPSATPPAASGSAEPPGGAALANATVSATIYGASWCGPCHQAEAFLKSLGVKVTKKDIEASEDAEREMQEVLKRAHRSGGSIPVIDLAGQVFVGFSDGALRDAVERARSARL